VLRRQLCFCSLPGASPGALQRRLLSLRSRTSTLCIRNGGASRDSTSYPAASTASTGAYSVSLVLAAGGVRRSFAYNRRRPGFALAHENRSPAGTCQRAPLRSVGDWLLAITQARSLGVGPNQYPPLGVDWGRVPSTRRAHAVDCERRHRLFAAFTADRPLGNSVGAIGWSMGGCRRA
jgi:hypothetical protein